MPGEIASDKQGRKPIKIVFEIYNSLDGMVIFGYTRNDLPVVHGIFQAEPGAFIPLYQLAEHFNACECCKLHEMTYELFIRFCEELNATDDIEFVNHKPGMQN